jgi:signal transduction histidine kinase
MVLDIVWGGLMKFRHSLRKRIVFTFCLFGAGLGIVFSFAIYISLDFIDDNMIDSRLSEEMDRVGVQYQEHSGLLSTNSPHINVYTGSKSMPEYAASMVEGISEGVHEKYYKGTEYHIAVKVYPNRTEPLYLFYDVSALEFTETRKFNIGIVLVIGVVLVVGMALWIGLMTSRKIIAPVVYLSEQVQKSGPENLPTDLHGSFSNDEVGLLSRTLETAMIRVDSFIKREKKFTRDASHELRTPVTVIKGAVEILKKQSVMEEKSIYRPVNRISRAVANMENIIETFLWLGREKIEIDSEQICEVVPVVQDVIKQQRRLHGDKSVEIDFFEEAQPILNVPPSVFRTVIVNLINNAFHHTVKGTISIQVCGDRISITDTGEGIDACELQTVTQPYSRGESSNGYGLGLSIVRRLCDRFGWRFQIESDVGKGTKVTLFFQPGSN